MRTRSGALGASFLALVASTPGLAAPFRAGLAPTAGPVILQGPTLTPNPNPSVPLAATVSLVTNVPTLVTLTIDDGSNVWSVTPGPGYATVHQTAVLGVRPGLAHSISVVVTDANGNSTAAPVPLLFTTPPLPSWFPPLHVDASIPGSMEPGVTMFDASFNQVSSGQSGGLIVMVDAAGEVVWFYQGADLVGDSRRLSNGNLIFNSGFQLITEIDMFGNPVTRWWASGLGTAGAPPGAVLVPVDTFHHEVFELPPPYVGDFLTLATEVRQYTNYPALESDPTQTVPVANVIGDVVVEFRRNGTVVRKWKLLDILDPYRISYGSLAPSWNHTYALDTEDWAHTNAVILDPSDNSMIVCSRHQEAVFKIDRATGGLVWILGSPDGWNWPWSLKLLQPERSAGSHTKAAGPFGALRDQRFEWSYHAHAPVLTPAGTLLLFDNGCGRAVAPAPELPLAERYSRAVEYEVDDVRRTIRQVWDHGGSEDKWYSAFLCDADPMPATGNVLICDGDHKVLATGKHWARVFEVTHEQPPKTVFQVRIEDTSATNPVSWTSYRAERLSDVYP